MTAYIVLDFSVHDYDTFIEYANRVPAFMQKHGGHYIVRGAEPEVMEGNWMPERLVIIEFPSRKDAVAFLDDPDFQELKEIRIKTTTSKLVLVDGVE